MSLWRFGRGWTDDEMKAYLADLKKRRVSFNVPPEIMTPANGWTVDGETSTLGAEPPGPPVPDGLFERAKQGLINYDFSDPRIVMGHFDPNEPFVGRNMMLEFGIFGLHFLGGVRVHSVREETLENSTLFGFRYDTLEGHFEKGHEWFFLTKNHLNGEVRFKIEAHWRLGTFPNWWSRLGFWMFGQNSRKIWRDRAPVRLRELAQRPTRKAVAAPGELAHRGDSSPQPTEPVLSGTSGEPG